MQTTKTPFVQTKKFSVVMASVLIIALIAGVMLGSSQVNKNYNENVALHGTVFVTVRDANGTVVSQTRNDTIYSASYDYIICYIWQTGCAYVNGLNFPSTTFITTATITSFQPYNSVLNAMMLSSGTQSTDACTNVINSNSLSPTIASSIVHNQGSNQVLLTASWTATGSQNVQSVCLGAGTTNAYIPQYPNSPLSGSTFSFASENFSTQSLTVGQSITIQWTFSF
jgi:hypothetical protein